MLLNGAQKQLRDGHLHRYSRPSACHCILEIKESLEEAANPNSVASGKNDKMCTLGRITGWGSKRHSPNDGLK